MPLSSASDCLVSVDFFQRDKPIQKFSIDTKSPIRTRLRTASLWTRGPCFSQHLGDAELRRKQQKFAAEKKHRKSQIFAETLFSGTLKSTYIIGVPKSEFSGSQKWGMKGEMKRSKWGKRGDGGGGGQNEGKRVGGKGRESTLEKL